MGEVASRTPGFWRFNGFWSRLFRKVNWDHQVSMAKWALVLDGAMAKFLGV